MNIHTSNIRRQDRKNSGQVFASFDVFDTFLVRACTTPDGVIERAFQLSPAFARHPDAVTSYVEHRRQAEARARRTALHERGSTEVAIGEIYRFFPFRLFGLTPDSAGQLADAEFSAELELCRVNPSIFARYSEMRASGVRTGFISDTYWSAQQLTTLLRSCCPGLQWDFLFASSQHGSSKSDKLFDIYLKTYGVDPRQAVHIGDNPTADIAAARRRSVNALHVPQASAALASVLVREATVERLLCPSRASMLDHGMRTLRRLAEPRATETSPAFDLGMTVLGPVMQAFDAFVADRVTQIARAGTRTRVAFLGRDGFLSHKIRALTDTSASYLEVNRRVSMIASARKLDPLVDLVRELPDIDAGAFAEMVKIRFRRVEAFFAKQPRGRCSGLEFAKALPGLLDKRELAALADDLRAELMVYLRQQIPDLDDCSDLVLIDLGYSGSIQKALRRIFDIEGIKTRIHGIYLLTLDDGFVECAPEDSFEGLISDLVVTPHAKRMLLRNVAVLEQLCCSPSGSVRAYRDGAVLHENNGLTEEQHGLARDVQRGVLDYVVAARELIAALDITPFANLAVAARCATTTLARFLLLPTDAELALLGGLQHDVNLGTAALTPLLDGDVLNALQVTRALPDACTAGDPPMWLAGSFAALSPAQSFHYLLFGTSLLCPDIFGDARCGQLDIGLSTRNGSTTTLPTACYRTGTGEIRIRIPMSLAMNVSSLTLPLASLASEGVINGPFLQYGESVAKAMRSTDILKLDGPELQTAGMIWTGSYYRAADDGAVLAIDLPVQTAPVALLSIGIAPTAGLRVLALD